MRDRLFQGLFQHLRDSMRFLYKQEGTTYEQLLADTREVEIEAPKGKGVTARSKSSTVPGTSGSSEIQAIQNKIDELTATLKTLKSADMGGARPKAQTPGKPGTPQKKGSGACPNNPNNSAHKFKGPGVSSHGSTREGQPPRQCYTCGGWNHSWREYLTKGNVNWGELNRREHPLPSTPAQTKNPTSKQ